MFPLLLLMINISDETTRFSLGLLIILFQVKVTDPLVLWMHQTCSSLEASCCFKDSMSPPGLPSFILTPLHHCRGFQFDLQGIIRIMLKH